MTFMLVDAKAGAPVPEHHHPNEQVTHLIEGDFELTVGGVLHRMKPGDVVAIPSNVPHSARAISDCRLMDVFSPRREDYAQGNFSAVSGKK
ncbi:MAG: cupin domain-containing protein [Alphaproteobacteria bacterium]